MLDFFRTKNTNIDRLNDSYVDVWEDVCNIESPSNDKDGVDRVGAYFMDIAKKQLQFFSLK